MKKKLWLMLSAPIVGMLLVAAGFVAFAGYLDGLSTEDYVQKVQVGPYKNLGYTSFDEVIAHVVDDSVFKLKQDLELQAEHGKVQGSYADFGLTVDVQPAVDHLMNMEQWLADANHIDRAGAFLHGIKMPLEVWVDEDQMEAFLLSSGIEQDPHDARFALEQGQLVILPEQIGYTVQGEALELQLMQAWEGDFDAMELPISVKEPDWTTAELEPHLDAVRHRTDGLITFQDEYGNTWEWSLADHVQWWIPAEEGLSINPNTFEQDMVVLAEIVNEEKQDAKISLDENGNPIFEGSARFGKILDVDSLRLDIQTNFDTQKQFVTPYHIQAPKVESSEELAARGITDLLGYGHSDFRGSPSNRIHNISVGMDIFDGLIVEQGEEFSFTTLMGPIDAAHGWLPELVILGDETKPEYGGGLCQVSSTMFRAALYTGLEISARKNHSYAVSYYARPFGYGLDATIYDPYPDFRFINNTPGDVLVQGYTEGSIAYFVLYGTNDGRTVQMEGPVNYGHYSISEPVVTYTTELEPGVRKLDDVAHVGFKTDWWRTIKYADGTVSERENFHSNYEARPNKYLEGKAEDEVAE